MKIVSFYASWVKYQIYPKERRVLFDIKLNVS